MDSARRRQVQHEDLSFGSEVAARQFDPLGGGLEKVLLRHTGGQSRAGRRCIPAPLDPDPGTLAVPAVRDAHVAVGLIVAALGRRFPALAAAIRLGEAEPE